MKETDCSVIVNYRLEGKRQSDKRPSTEVSGLRDQKLLAQHLGSFMRETQTLDEGFVETMEKSVEVE